MIPRLKPGKRSKFEQAILFIDWLNKRRRLPRYGRSAIISALTAAAAERTDGLKTSSTAEYIEHARKHGPSQIIHSVSQEGSRTAFHQAFVYSDSNLTNLVAELWQWRDFALCFVRKDT